MGETDRQTDKTTRWAFTAYEEQWDLFKVIPDIVKEWGWQTEVCPETKRKHYQGYLLTRTQQRFSAIRKLLPGVHIEAARNWSALLNYCKKAESAIEGTQVTQTNERKYLKFADALVRIANAFVLIPWVEGDSQSEYQELLYKKAVETLCLTNPDDISLYSNPQMFRAWKMCQGLWLRMALHSHEDGCQSDECDLCSHSDGLCAGHAVVAQAAEDIFSRCSIVSDEGW